ncbi:MAG: DUF58 domain-containing protein, partial [Planctomycetota bacterium]
MIPNQKQRQFIDTQALARLSALPLFSRRAMLGNVSGMHASPHRGSSVEFAEYRRYVPGDDLRRLDWRAYGRTDRFYVKEFEADTNLRAHLVLDTSGSMDFIGKGAKKIEYAKRLLAALAHLAIQQGDAVGLTNIAESITQTIPPRRTPSHLRGLYDVLENTTAGGVTRLADRLHEFAETTRQRALVVIASDLFVDLSELREAIDHLRFSKHDVAIFHLLDRQELDFAFSRPTRFLDMEGEDHVFADPNDISDRYHSALAGYLRDMSRMMLEAGVDYHRVVTDQNDEHVLSRFL